MSISLGVVYGLAILLPGFFFYGSIFVSRINTGLTSSSPAPNSILRIFLIGLGACLAHAIGVLIVNINTWLSNHIYRIETPFNPDFYETLRQLAGSNTGDLGAALLFLLGLSVLTFFVGKVCQKILPDLFRDIRYGSYSHIVRDSKSPSRVLVAYIITQQPIFSPSSQQNDMLGYEGIVANIVHDKLGVNGIHLFGAVPFRLKKTSTKLNRTAYGDSGDPIPHLYIPKSDIVNIAIDVIDIED